MMGAESMGIVTVKLHFTDPKVCKNYLCGTCPHIVFTNTVSPTPTTDELARRRRRAPSSELASKARPGNYASFNKD